MKTNHWLLGLGLAFCLGCDRGNTVKVEKAPEKTQVDLLKDEVMATHDSAMAKYGELYLERKRLSQQADSLPNGNVALKEQYGKTILELIKADDAMMQWMRSYQAPDSLSQDAAMQYLQKEKQEIEAIQQQIQKSLAQAKALDPSNK
ncbi:hypothetical protein [Nibribacter koreensis]|uniref:Viral A-type inclusion protein n=1 Tax=Nibribacter koreensis TaxID=1084519 RepID=A0ABP8FGF5_9BACT